MPSAKQSAVNGQPNITVANLLMRWVLPALIVTASLYACNASAASATLAWNPTPAAAGYVVYTSPNGSKYTRAADVGASTNITLAGMTPGATNYFYVTAYNSAHMQTRPSAAVSYIVPGGLVMGAKATPRSPAQVQFSVATGHTYKVQASADLKKWTTLYTTTATNNSWMTYQDPLGATLKLRFYRTVSN